MPVFTDRETQEFTDVLYICLLAIQVEQWVCRDQKSNFHSHLNVRMIDSYEFFSSNPYWFESVDKLKLLSSFTNLTDVNHHHYVKVDLHSNSTSKVFDGKLKYASQLYTSWWFKGAGSIFTHLCSNILQTIIIILLDIFNFSWMSSFKLCILGFVMSFYVVMNIFHCLNHRQTKNYITRCNKTKK